MGEWYYGRRGDSDAPAAARGTGDWGLDHNLPRLVLQPYKLLLRNSEPQFLTTATIPDGGRVAKITSFRDLEVWGYAMALTEHCYRATDSFPASERYGLSSQIRRAAASIPANLAEGHGRSTRVFMNHVSIAIGSQAELDTLLELGCRLNLLPVAQRDQIDVNLRRTGKMLHGLLRALAGSTSVGAK